MTDDPRLLYITYPTREHAVDASPRLRRIRSMGRNCQRQTDHVSCMLVSDKQTMIIACSISQVQLCMSRRLCCSG